MLRAKRLTLARMAGPVGDPTDAIRPQSTVAIPWSHARFGFLNREACERKKKTSSNMALLDVFRRGENSFLGLLPISATGHRHLSPSLINFLCLIILRQGL